MLEEPVESDNRAWMPDAPLVETYTFDVPADLSPGALPPHRRPRARVRQALARPIELGLTEDRRHDGRYRLVDITVE